MKLKRLAEDFAVEELPTLQAGERGRFVLYRLSKRGMGTLEAVEAAGVEPPHLCRGGACGQCETAVVSCDGTLLHNDHYLSPRDREGGVKIMICVSRLRGRELVVDL